MMKRAPACAEKKSGKQKNQNVTEREIKDRAETTTVACLFACHISLGDSNKTSLVW